MAGTLSRSKPSPVTGVVATTWNAGICGAGAGVDGREGAGAATRREGAERAGVAAGVARRTGAGRGAVTVTSGSVSVTCAQATLGSVNASGNSKALTATAPNRRRLPTSSRDAARPRPPARYTARPHELSKSTGIFPRCSCDLLAIRIGTFGNVAARPHCVDGPSIPARSLARDGGFDLLARDDLEAQVELVLAGPAHCYEW
jgi:hypothetical protein